MGTSVLFAALNDRGDPEGIPQSQFARVLRQFSISVDEFDDGDHVILLVTPTESLFKLNDEASVSVQQGSVVSVFIDRPCSPGSHQLWYAFLDLGFVLITAHDGQAYATARVAREIGHLFNNDVKVLERSDDFLRWC